MFQPVSMFIGLRYSGSRHRTGFVSFITFFSIVGILLGVSSLITVVSVMNGFESQLKKSILGVVPQVVVSKDKGSLGNWQTLQEKLEKSPHVVSVTPLIEEQALIQSSKHLQGVLLQGIRPVLEKNSMVSKHITYGSLSSLSEANYNMVLGQSLAYKLNVSVGDSVRLVLPNKTFFTPMGRVPVERTFTVTGLFNTGSQVDDAMVYIHSNYAAKLLRLPGEGIDKLRLYLDDAFNATLVVSYLEKHNDGNLVFTTWKESQGTLFSAVSMEKKMMWFMLSLIVAVAAFNIVSALVMVVIEKQGEIAILQTLGLSRGSVVKIFITQGMINGLWGVALGAVFGVLITLNLNAILAFLGVNLLGGMAMQQLPIQLELSKVFIIMLSALSMSFLATLYPAYKASKTQPAEVLRNE
ncbi:MAG: lipoprotein-releasing ABC transporter permease subunit [Colwellia sp.]